jgi:hypothetical protein
MKYDISNSKKTKMKIWSELGIKFNLSFSRCLSVGNRFLGLDKHKRKLLVSANNSGLTNCQIIDLQKIKSVSVKKRYDSIKAGELTKRKFEEFLKSIHLRFEHIDKNITVFPFYKRGRDNLMDAGKMDLASKSIQLMLSKYLRSS